MDVHRLTWLNRSFVIHRQPIRCDEFRRIVGIEVRFADFVRESDAGCRELSDADRLRPVVGRMECHAQRAAWNIVLRMGHFNRERIRLDRQGLE